MNIPAWQTPPPLAELAAAVQNRARPLHLLICLGEREIPEFTVSDGLDDTQCRLKTALDESLKCIQFNSINVFEQLLPDVTLWLAPPKTVPRLQEHFGGHNLDWQTDEPKQIEAEIPALSSAEEVKPWFRPSENRIPPENVLIIGAGIAGAAMARLLAEQGVRTTVLEAGAAARGGSGNRQGLLYAKISPHNTEQTELLLAGYGYTRRLLARLLPGSDAWGGSGVVHLNYDGAERKRNQALALQAHHAHLYRAVSQAEAAEIAGVELFSDGLYWPQGVWLNPPAVVRALLDHPLVSLHEHTPLQRAEFDGENWTAHTPQGRFSGSHIIYCTGADSPAAPEPNAAALPYRQIRGQTGVAQATAFSERLKCAVSGESYISPAWQGSHCYGATFVLNSADKSWRTDEEAANRAALAQLNPPLAQSLFSDGRNGLETATGHAALRCDSPDHLPLVGALGDIAAMQTVYAKLALDKNYRLTAPCPYLPRAYLNTAHGTRGLATAPLCAAALTAEILGLPHPLSRRLRTALHPNRTVIRAIVRGQGLLK
ncbi:FAD-dependent 5-carboxymethylaminomethyl-2-thiouridine(34) oxidoreductase MnmC [Neisseria chenwenguii]|uniref:FAD-dependent 5-carboxymethylaminomethyl-2-thiouridine(34) oxidoreductase MnmC n=1 Tax=Neisseria chenwenguii TaxID=1853278 RepID=UPI000F4E30AC|nr:FAD-dependent 5-carboxymethylaminomethyl-2-thiouridine(34) oxidoreductase MnmC [Neisseria chenwenguii]ROV57288.1 FAD-dependent oxidoreductase [Neisseria chenwenguii]